MLHENIRAIRKSKGLSQEKLANRLHVVRQTVSKWEQGLSVPDADMLISLSEVFEIPVSTLLGETVAEVQPDEIKAVAKIQPDEIKVLAEKLEAINFELAQKKETRRKIIHGSFIALCSIVVITFVLILVLHSVYLEWDYDHPETAVIGVGLHSFEWIFVRVAPFVLLGGVAGAVVTKKRKR